MKVNLNFKSYIELLLTHAQMIGHAEANMGMSHMSWNETQWLFNHSNFFFIENVELTVRLTTDIVHRNGRDYLELSDINTSFDASYFHIDFKCQNTTPLLNDIVNRLANANWKICKRMIYNSVDKYITEIMKSVIQPIIVDLAVQDF